MNQRPDIQVNDLIQPVTYNVTVRIYISGLSGIESIRIKHLWSFVFVFYYNRISWTSRLHMGTRSVSVFDH